MWDSHFRVGGAVRTNLRIDDCPRTTTNVDENCMAAALLLHLTRQSSGYFENVWIWTADHDMDIPHDFLEDGNTTTSAQINIYTARGTLIESQGPIWLYSTGSEYHTFYQYQLLNARNIFITHMQTESPYYQASPDASELYPLRQWQNDPPFGECSEGSACMKSWAVRVLSSRDVLLHSAGLYSFFEAYEQNCLDDESCQLNLVEL